MQMGKEAAQQMKRVAPVDIETDEDWRSSGDWYVPCWLDQAAYPAPDALTPSGWAWQFLRRYPQYRSDWQWRGSVTPGVYALRQFIHPAESPAEPEFGHAPHPPKVIIGPKVPSHLWATEVAIVFDRTRPLQPQFDQIKKDIPMRLPRRQRRLQKEKYPLY
jgi:hypothetical protein